MPEYRVNDSAVRQARQLIDDGRFDDRTEWSDAAPDAAAANDVIEQEGFDAFAAWHLAEDPDASEGTKGRYAFPYGDFRTVNRAALIQRLPPQRLPAVPGRGQPPGVRHGRVRRPDRAGGARQGRRAAFRGAAGRCRAAAGRGGRHRRHLP